VLPSIWLVVVVSFQRLVDTHYYDYCVKNPNMKNRFYRNRLKRWSGRRDSNPRRPAWEVTRHLNFRHVESAGVGLESTETPGKTAVHRERLLMECNWSAAVTSNVFSQQEPCFLPATMASATSNSHPTNANGPRWNASHRPNGVEIEFLQQQYTSPPSAKKRRKCSRRARVCRRRTMQRND
jgi:hypothetical protein